MKLAALAGKPLVALLSGLSAVIVLLLAGLAWQTSRALDARELAGANGQALEQCQENSEHHRAEMIAARDELAGMVTRLAIEAQALSEGLIEAERRDRDRERAALADQRQRQVILATDADCDAWARLELCEPLAEQRRQRRQALNEQWNPEP